MGKVHDIQDITDNIVGVKGKMHKNIHKKRHYFNMNAERQCNIFIGHGHKHNRNAKSTNNIIDISDGSINTNSNISSNYTYSSNQSSKMKTESIDSESTVYDESTTSAESSEFTKSDKIIKSSGQSSYEHVTHKKQTTNGNNDYINGIKKGLMKFYMDRGINNNEKITKPIRIKLEKSETSTDDSDDESYSPRKNNVNGVDVDIMSNKRTKKIAAPLHFIKGYGKSQAMVPKKRLQENSSSRMLNTVHVNNITKNNSKIHRNTVNNNTVSSTAAHTNDCHHGENTSSNEDATSGKCQTISELGICHKKSEPVCEKFVDAKLSSALTVCTDSSNVTSSISKHGKYIYMVYNKKCVDASGNIIVAEILENKCGKLKTKRDLYLSEDFVNVNSGYASSLFDRFTIIEDNGIDTARLKLMDSCFNTIATRSYQYLSNNGSVIGGNFVFGDKYIVVTYISDPFSSSGRQISKLSLLFSETLEEVCEFIFEGNTSHIVESIILDHHDGCHDNMYLLLSSSDDEFGDGCPYAESFSVFKLLCFNGKCISLVDQVTLPQAAQFSCIKKDEKLYVSIGTTRADVKKVENPFNKKMESLIPEDGNELRLYRYCDHKKKLILLYTKNTDSCVFTKFHPHNHSILIHQFNFQMNTNPYGRCKGDCSQYPGTFTINNVHLHCDDAEIKQSNLPYIVSPLQFDAVFSGNGKWLLVTGSDTSSIHYGIKNIQLFSIKN